MGDGTDSALSHAVMARGLICGPGAAARRFNANRSRSDDQTDNLQESTSMTKPENTSGPPSSPRVGLFVTCLVDTMRPSVGFAALKLLREVGCRVEVPQAQTCCGQPAFNSGDTPDTASLARRFIETFEPFDFVVAPPGSCVGMTRAHYAEALADDPAWADRARRLGEKTFELMSFLVDVMGFVPAEQTLAASATYHDSCSGLRELGVFEQPRTLLGRVSGLELRKLEGNDVCCGFGGTFCVKYPAI